VDEFLGLWALGIGLIVGLVIIGYAPSVLAPRWENRFWINFITVPVVVVALFLLFKSVVDIGPPCDTYKEQWECEAEERMKRMDESRTRY